MCSSGTCILDSRDLVAQLGREVAALLSSALDRVLDLTSSGRIDSSGLRALRDEIEQARRAGIIGQQLVRLTQEDLKLQRERLDLTHLLRDLLQQRAREIEARGTEVRQQFEQVNHVSLTTRKLARHNAQRLGVSSKWSCRSTQPPGYWIEDSKKTTPELGWPDCTA